MPRKHRVWYPGAIYHIMARGNKRSAIFIDHLDYLKYLEILEEVRKKFPFKLHSYCLMTNHLHLQLETTQHHVQHVMKDLHSRYAIYFNQRLKIDGHVFQGRYGAKFIENDDYFLEVSRYIHRNPLQAKMVGNLVDYQWSSYPSFVNLNQTLISIKQKLILILANKNRTVTDFLWRKRKSMKWRSSHVCKSDKYWVKRNGRLSS